MESTKTLVEMVDRAFAWAAKNLPGFMLNDAQTDYSRLVAQSLEIGMSSREEKKRSAQLLVEGETGTGKTLGYLIPAMLHAVLNNRRVVISTYTLMLQKQIMGEPGGTTSDFQRANTIVHALTGRSLTVARRIGRPNWVDVDRVQFLIDEYVRMSKADVVSWLRDLLVWASDEHCSGLIADYTETHPLPEELMADDFCLTSESEEEARIHYTAHVEACKTADVVLVTHAMLTLTGMCGLHLLHHHGDVREIGAIIVDEADRLPDVARDLTGSFVSLHSLSRSVQKTVTILGEPEHPAVGLAKILTDAFSNAYNGKQIEFWDDLSLSNREALSRQLEVFLRVATPIARAAKQRLHENSLSVRDADAMEGFVEQFTELTAAFKLSSDKDTGNKGAGLAVRWSPKKEWASLKTFDLFPARILSHLWNAYTDNVTKEVESPSLTDALVLTSATLSTPSRSGDGMFFDTLINFGIWEHTNPCQGMHRAFSPVTFGSARFVFPDPSVPSPFICRGDDANLGDAEAEEEVEALAEVSPEWLEYATTMIQAASQSKPTANRTLALMGGFRVTGMLAEALRSRGVRVIEHCRGTRLSELKEAFLADETAILLSPSAWEGVDWPHLIDNVVIAQIPFAAPDDIRYSAVTRYLQSKGRSVAESKGIQHAQSFASAARKLKQGFGRGIRAYDDSFTCWIADPRFVAASCFLRDLSGVVPSRGTARAMIQLQHAIPRRFRNGFHNPFDAGSRMLLKDGKFVATKDLGR